MNRDPRSTYSQLLAERQAEISAAGAGHRALGILAAGGGGMRRGDRRHGSISALHIGDVGGHPGWWFSSSLAVRHERLLRVLERRRPRGAVLRARSGAAGRALGRHRRAGRPLPGSRRIPTRRTSTCSAKARCSSCSPRPAHTSARTRWRAGCWRRRIRHGARAAGGGGGTAPAPGSAGGTGGAGRRGPHGCGSRIRWPPGAKRRRGSRGRGLRLALWACTALGLPARRPGVTLMLHLTGLLRWARHASCCCAICFW